MPIPCNAYTHPGAPKCAKIDVFLYGRPPDAWLSFWSMSPEERIGVLCAQLLRATNPEVARMVADELKDAVDTPYQLSKSFRL
jgi:hypothetical protein